MLINVIIFDNDPRRQHQLYCKYAYIKIENQEAIFHWLEQKDQKNINKLNYENVGAAHDTKGQ